MVLRTPTKDENVPGSRTSVTVGARIGCRPNLAHMAAREPDAAYAQRWSLG
jgi:hypothetical protein